MGQSFTISAADGKGEKSCLQQLHALYPYQPTCFLNIAIENIRAYVSFNKIMLSLQIFCGVAA